MKIGFIGVGKLGKACAEMMAEKHDVIGYDINQVTPENFSMASSIKDAATGRDIIFVAVQTPHDPLYDGSAPTSHLPNKDFDYSVVESVLSALNEFVTSDQLVVLISTVLPGTVRRQLEKLISNGQFLYNPYLIAMGTVKWDMVNPEMIMIGNKTGISDKHVSKLKNFYLSIMENDPPIIQGTWEEIECLKVFYNTFISAKVSLVNMIQDVAEKLGHINSELVCDALASCDRRIMGPAYMKPGMGDGGACHPRDNIALRYLAADLNLGYDLFDAVMASREIQAKNLASFLVSYQKPVVIVGKAYKPLVEYTNGSYSMLVGHYVSEMQGQVYYHDDVIGEYPPEDLGPCTYLLAHSPEVTYGNQLDHVKKFHQDHSVSGSKELEHSSVIFNTGKDSRIVFNPNSTVVDPWRKFPLVSGLEVIHYGDTRDRVIN